MKLKYINFRKIFSSLCMMARLSFLSKEIGGSSVWDRVTGHLNLPVKRTMKQNDCRNQSFSDNTTPVFSSKGSTIKGNNAKGHWLCFNNYQLLSLFICFTIVSIPVVCISIGYMIGTYFMPPAVKFPSPGIIMDMSQMNYSWYNSHNISIEFIGGLGNQMFQYASLYGLGKANGLKPLISDQSMVVRTFRLLRARRTEDNNDVKLYGFYQERRSNAFDQRTFSLNFMRNVRLEGYFQSWRYFDHIRSDLRKQFVFRSSVIKQVDDFLYEARDNFLLTHRDEIQADGKIDIKFVGIHIRRGDFLDSYNIKKGYTVASKQYLSKAVRYYENKYNRVIFVVCSDDMPWSQENFSSSKSMIVFSKFQSSPQLDMCLLSKCNHSVITVGTFGWWGAWLAGGETIYYRDYPQIDSSLRDNFRMSDYYLPNWIAM